MAERKSVSMQDLADKLGISKVTVSKALNGKDGVGEELKEKIFALARESGYVLPDYGKRKSKKVGIIMSPRFSSGDEGKFYMAMYERIIYELQRASCSSIMISPTTATLPSDMNTIQTRGLFDGLIFLGILDKGVREQIAQIDLPKVYVDIYDQTHKSDSVITENIYSSYELTNYLIQQGHRKIAVLGGPVTSYPSVMRRQCAQQAMEDAGILFNDKLYGLSNYDFESAYHAMNSLLARRAEFTALFAMSDVIAFGAIRALVSAGMRVPEDVSVIGFDGITMSRYCVPVMTTIVQPSEQIALQSIELLVRQIEHGAPAQTVTLQPELQQGESVCPCRRNDSV